MDEKLARRKRLLDAEYDIPMSTYYDLPPDLQGMDPRRAVDLNIDRVVNPQIMERFPNEDDALMEMERFDDQRGSRQQELIDLLIRQMEMGGRLGS